MKKVAWVVAALLVLGLLGGCGETSPESKYFGTWSNDTLKYGTIVLSEKSKSELKNFNGNTASTSWKLGDKEGAFILISDGKGGEYKARFVVGDNSILIVTVKDKDEYMYKQE